MNHQSRYKEAGVDIDAGNRTVDLMKRAVRSTHTTAVLSELSSFGGLFALHDLPTQPVLVASTDGVGTKVKLAAQFQRWQGIGHDIVNHCVNDILVQNARPLFFLDYIASSKLVPEQVAAVVEGIADACRAAGCALLGGETAEMPGVYAEGAFDLVGTVVGLVDRTQLYPRTDAMHAGDLLFGLPSSGPHTNGYSLIRHLIAERDPLLPLTDGQTLLDALLQPHRSYLSAVDQLRQAEIPIHALAHITGGGFTDNIPRVLPPALQAVIEPGSWTVPPLFVELTQWADMDWGEALRVFNMGIGMVIVAPAAAQQAISQLLPDAVVIGELAKRTAGEPAVVY
ncbi:MAG: phosphoribosylformylglycinamidine cyclo-ligase [Caldilineaceae bacterium]|nr:phosphoribosylformylglycinamidine cyclo-ligase [Caldilineaceae bacterium]